MEDYIKNKYSALGDATSLFSMKRRLLRFSRFRAKQKTIHNIAKRIAKPITRKPELKDQLRSIIFFGKALFGHGSKGALPRKQLLKKLGYLSVVVLTDEFRTSKCCCCCGSELRQVHGSRVYTCLNGARNGESTCVIRFIDRDTNAASSIGHCGALMLQGRERPQFLCRRNHDDTAVVNSLLLLPGSRNPLGDHRIGRYEAALEDARRGSPYS